MTERTANVTADGLLKQSYECVCSPFSSITFEQLLTSFNNDVTMQLRASCGNEVRILEVSFDIAVAFQTREAFFISNASTE